MSDRRHQLSVLDQWVTQPAQGTLQLAGKGLILMRGIFDAAIIESAGRPLSNHKRRQPAEELSVQIELRRSAGLSF